MWWGIFLIALSVPHGWTATMSPATITFLLLYVSGIPMAERLFDDNADYKRYAKKTSAFFPWFAKK
jgi:steroid 5-alpha reductase family enzyme